MLLTGATGFFGAHLLKELLARPGVRVICLVRGGDKKRLEDTLSWYFGAGWIAGVRSRIQTADGDLALPRLGMEEKQWKALAEEIDGIYHSAADVRHYAADAGEFLTTNVTGTETMIGLALQADAMLHYISTASISGDFLVGEPEKTAVFTEADFYIGQNWEDNIYIRSKFLAEAEVYRAMEEKGLHARVYRLGRITGRCTDQVFQRNPENNAAFLLMRAVRCAGAITESMARLPVDLTPVDWCASAVLALGKSRRTAFHLLNPLPPSMKEVALAMVPGLLIVPDSSYGPLLLARMTDANRDILAPLLDYHNRTGAGESRIRVDCTVTLEAFKEEGFTWAIPPAAHLTEGFSGLFS